MALRSSSTAVGIAAAGSSPRRLLPRCAALGALLVRRLVVLGAEGEGDLLLRGARRAVFHGASRRVVSRCSSRTRRRGVPRHGRTGRRHAARRSTGSSGRVRVGARRPPGRARACLDPLAVRASAARRPAHRPSGFRSRRPTVARLLLRARRACSSASGSSTTSAGGSWSRRCSCRGRCSRSGRVSCSRPSSFAAALARRRFDTWRSRVAARLRLSAIVVVAVAAPWRIWYIAHDIEGEAGSQGLDPGRTTSAESGRLCAVRSRSSGIRPTGTRSWCSSSARWSSPLSRESARCSRSSATLTAFVLARRGCGRPGSSRSPETGVRAGRNLHRPVHGRGGAAVCRGDPAAPGLRVAATSGWRRRAASAPAGWSRGGDRRRSSPRVPRADDGQWSSAVPDPRRMRAAGCRRRARRRRVRPLRLAGRSGRAPGASADGRAHGDGDGLRRLRALESRPRRCAESRDRARCPRGGRDRRPRRRHSNVASTASLGP